MYILTNAYIRSSLTPPSPVYTVDWPTHPPLPLCICTLWMTPVPYMYTCIYTSFMVFKMQKHIRKEF